MLTDPVSEHANNDSDSNSNGIDDHSLERLQRLEALVQGNPSDYDAHTKLISLLSELGLKQRLDAARTAFADRFPLTEQHWTAWIADLSDSTTSEADAAHLLSVAERSVGDYLSVELWAQYLTCLSLAHPEVAAHTAEGVRLFRGRADAALAACVPHVAAGRAVFEPVLLFEDEELQSALQARDASAADSVAASDGAAAPLARLRKLWAKRLSSPLLGDSNALKEYEAWDAQLPEALREGVPDRLLQAHQRAQAAVAVRAAFEAAVSEQAQADEALLAAFGRYVAFERTQGAAARPRVRALLERAVARFPVTTELWLELGAEVDGSTSLPEDDASVLAVHERACRNCPASGPVWAARLLAVERCQSHQHEGLEHGESRGLLRRVYDEALQIGLGDLDDYVATMEAFLNATRRFCAAGALAPEALAAAYREALELLAAYFPSAALARNGLCEAWARAEVALGAVVGRQSDEGLLAWCAGLERDRQTFGAAQFEAFARHAAGRGEVKAARRVLTALLGAEKKGTATAGHPARITCAAELVALEAAHGSADDEVRARLLQRKVLVAARSAEGRAADAPAEGAREVDGGVRKRKATQGGSGVQQGPQKARKREGARERSSGGAPQGRSGASSGAEKRYTDARTVFVKHLAPDVQEADLSVLFPAATSVRLVRKKGGASKGCAYLDFSSEADVEAALRRDREVYHDRHIFVARSRPPGKSGGNSDVGRSAPDFGSGADGGAGDRRGKERPPQGANKGHRGDGKKSAKHAADASSAAHRAAATARAGAQRDTAAPVNHPHTRLGLADSQTAAGPAVKAPSKPATRLEGNDEFRKALGL